MLFLPPNQQRQALNAVLNSYPQFVYLFKHQRQRAQATYTPAKSSTIMHVIQRYKIKQYDKRKMAVIEWEGKITMHIKQLRHTKFVTR